MWHANDIVLAYMCVEIGVDYVRSEVIGNFPEEEARQFFRDVALPRAGQECEMSEGVWAKVWEV